MSKIIKHEDIEKAVAEATAPSECVLIKVDFIARKVRYKIQIGKL